MNPLASRNPRTFSIFVIQDFSDVEKIYEKINAENFFHHGHFIFVLINREIIGIQKIFNDLWKLQIYNVIVIVEDGHENISIFTFFPFRSRADCSNTTPVLINKFINGTLTRGLSNIFPNKMNNLQQCDIKVATSNNKPPFIYMKTMLDGSTKFTGRDFELLDALSKHLNFKINFTLLSEFSCITEYKGKEGVIKNLQNNKSDLAIVDCWLKASRLLLFDASTTFSIFFLQKCCVKIHKIFLSWYSLWSTSF